MPVYRDKYVRKPNSWYFKTSIKGKQFLKRGFESRAEAKMAEEAFRLTYSEKFHRIKFHVMIKAFLENYKMKVKESSYVSCCIRVNKYLKQIENIYFDEVNFSVLNRWWNSIDATINLRKRLMIDLKKLFEFADVYYGIHNVEYKKLIVPKDYSIKMPKERYILSISDFKKLYDAAENSYWKLLFLIAFICGLRVGEVRGLLVSSVDYEKQRILINSQIVDLGKGHAIRTSVKTENSLRYCVVPEHVINMIKKHVVQNRLNESDPLFFGSYNSGRNPLSEYVIDKHLKKAQLKAGLPLFRFHTFRKSEGSILNDAGLSGEVIKAFMGHESFETTRKYYLGDSSEKQRVVQTLLEEKFKDFRE